MGGWLTSLFTWCRLPVRGGFAELDMQINKLRTLRDSYQTPAQGQHDAYTTEVEKGGRSYAYHNLPAGKYIGDRELIFQVL